MAFHAPKTQSNRTMKSTRSVGLLAMHLFIIIGIIVVARPTAYCLSTNLAWGSLLLPILYLTTVLFIPNRNNSPPYYVVLFTMAILTVYTLWIVTTDALQSNNPYRSFSAYIIVVVMLAHTASLFTILLPRVIIIDLATLLLFSTASFWIMMLCVMRLAGAHENGHVHAELFVENVFVFSASLSSTFIAVNNIILGLLALKNPLEKSA